jgi:hypothetical protein
VLNAYHKIGVIFDKVSPNNQFNQISRINIFTSMFKKTFPLQLLRRGYMPQGGHGFKFDGVQDL